MADSFPSRQGSVKPSPPGFNWNPVHIALRITFLIVGPVPTWMLGIGIAALVEFVVELIAQDSWYYQQHAWCPALACFLGGSACLAAFRIPYLEHGLWFGPLLIAFGIYFCMQ